MKKQFTNILRLFLIMILAGLTASCSFWSDSIEEHEESPEACVSADSADSSWTFTVNGTISIKDGAFPSSIINASKGKRASRSAMPEIPTDLTCSITAISGSNTQTATTSDNKNYTLVLEGGKNWTVTAVLDNSEGNPVLSDTWTIPASNTETNLSHNFWVRPAASNGGSGKVELTITINNELKNTISRVSTSCKSSNDENWEASITPDDITFEESNPAEIVIRQNSIPSGVYEVSINFYNSENVLVYNTIQSINVFDNLTTNTWVAGNNLGPIKTNGTFELTKSLVDGYSKTHLYVGETHFGTAKADDASGTGSASKPFQSVTGAINYLKKVGSAEQDYTIYVVGTVDGAQEIEDTDSSTPIPASSITLEGFYGLDDNDVPQDVLNGGLDEDNEGQTLLISTSIPVTIKNLTITGGYQFNNYGAGISVSGDSKVYLEDGTLITGNHSEAAGAAIGIYDNATVTMNGGVIENNASKYEFEGTDFSGTVVIFKEDRNEAGTPKFIMNGGTIKKNTTFFYGGGVGVALDGVFEMNGGTIGGTSEEDANIADTDGTSSENARSTYGGGVYVGDGGSFVMTGGLIANNKATGIGTDPQGNHQYMNCGGGGVAVCEGGSFEMKAGETTTGTISSNTSARNGGGVYIDSENSTFKMTAGIISGNTSTNEGKGVYLNSSNSIFKMGLGAIVQPDGTGANDVYLPAGAVIAITNAIDGDIDCVAKITPAEYNTTTTVLSAEGVNLEYEYQPFAVTPQVTGEAGNQTTTNWYITNEGKLTTTDPNGGGGNGNAGTEGFSLIPTGTITRTTEIAPTAENYENDGTLLIPNMYVCNHLVTQSEYEQYMTYYGAEVTGTEEGQAGSSTPYKPRSTDNKETTPAYYVSWIEAIIYCNLRSIKDGLTPVYSRSEITDPAVWAGWDESTVVISNGKYYYNSTSGDSGYDTDSSFKINQAANGYRLASSAEYMYIVDKDTELTGISGMYEWTQTFTYSEAERCYFSGDLASSGNVTGQKNNAYRGSDMGFRVVRYQLNAGDVLTTSGEIIPYNASNLTYSEEMIGEAAGVIYDVNEKGAPRGVLGLYSGSASLWGDYDIPIEEIICTPSSTDANTATFTGDVDGSDNWDKISSNTNKFPPFAFAVKYGTDTATNLSGTSYSSDWYVPSIAELCYIYRNKTAINNVLNALKEGNTSISIVSGNSCSSSCCTEEIDGDIWEIEFDSGTIGAMYYRDSCRFYVIRKL